MKRIFAFALIAAFFVLGHSLQADVQRLDGIWFDETSCYGCPGDPVVAAVKAQMKAFDAADAAFEANPNSTTAKAAADLSLFSYDEAGYLLEAGHYADLGGDTVLGQAFYKGAALFAQKAINLADRPNWLTRKGDSVVVKSHEEGKNWLEIAKKHLN